MFAWHLRVSFALLALFALVSIPAQAAFNPWSADFFARFGVTRTEKVDGAKLNEAMAWLATQSMTDTQRAQATDAFFEAYNTLSNEARRSAYQQASPEPQTAPPATPTFAFELFNENPYRVFGYEASMHPTSEEIGDRARELSAWIDATPKLNDGERTVAKKHVTDAAVTLLSREQRRILDKSLERKTMMTVIDLLDSDSSMSLLPNRVFEVARVASGDYPVVEAKVQAAAIKLLNEKITTTIELPIFKNDEEALPLIRLAMRMVAESTTKKPCPWAAGVLENRYLSNAMREEVLALVLETAIGENAEDPIELVDITARILTERPELGRGFVARVRSEGKGGKAFLSEVWNQLHFPENFSYEDLPRDFGTSPHQGIFEAFSGNLHLLAGTPLESQPPRPPVLANPKALKAADVISEGLREMGKEGIKYAKGLERCLSDLSKLARANRREADSAEAARTAKRAGGMVPFTTGGGPMVPYNPQPPSGSPPVK